MKTINIAALAAAAMLAAACTDYSDYNEAYSDASDTAGKSLAQNIADNPQLSKFYAQAKAVGFDQQLASDHTYTVFAPLDEDFPDADFQALMNADSATVAAQFVRNHVADYNLGANGIIDTKVKMLNGKTIRLEGAPGAYTFGGVPVEKANIPNANGLLYILKGQVHYYPNLYQYIDYAEGIDSLRAYFAKHELSTLNEKNSVAGPIVDGKQTWVHEVYDTSNWLTRGLSAQFAAEDSSYTFIMPNNEAWNARYAEVSKAYKYIASMEYNDYSAEAVAKKTATVDAAYVADSLRHLMTVRDLVYSNNDLYNKWTVDAAAQRPAGSTADTIRTTTWSKLSNPEELLDPANIVHEEAMSNGRALIVSHVADRPWETYMSSRRASLIANKAGLKNAERVTREYLDPTTGEKMNYTWIKPTTAKTKPEANFWVQNALATTYRVYCVWVPDSVSEDYGLLPNNNMFSITYCNAKGTLSTAYFDAKTHATKNKESDCEAYYTHRANIASGVLDTMYIGEVELPVAYTGAASNADYFGPNIKIYQKWTGTNKNLLLYNNDIRITGVFLRPVAEDEHDPWRKDGNDPE